MRPRDHLQRRMGCPKCRSRPSLDGSPAVTPKASRLGQNLLQCYATARMVSEAALDGSHWTREKSFQFLKEIIKKSYKDTCSKHVQNMFKALY